MLPRFETHNTEFVYNLISLLNLLPFLVIIDMHTHLHNNFSDIQGPLCWQVQSNFYTSE